MYESNGQQIDLSCFGDIVFNTDDQAERHNYSYTPCRNGMYNP